MRTVRTLDDSRKGPASIPVPAWSPDGPRIAFHSSDSSGADILIMNADGSEQRAITAAGSDDYHPAWSPDGAWIVFCVGQKNQFNLLPHAPDGRDRERLSQHAGRNQSPQWRPAGRR